MYLNPIIAYEDDPNNDDIHQPHTAYNQGYEAFDSGYSESFNPYDHGTREFDKWLEGHRDAGDHEEEYQ